MKKGAARNGLLHCNRLTSNQTQSPDRSQTGSLGGRVTALIIKASMQCRLFAEEKNSGPLCWSVRIEATCWGKPQSFRDDHALRQ